MEQYNYERELELKIKELETATINNAGAKSILEWFYVNMDNIDLFEKEEYASLILKTLKNAGFQENTTPKEELDCLNKLLSKHEDNSSEVNGSLIISLIMDSIKNNVRMPIEYKQLVEMYNEKYNKETIMPEMMKTIEEHIGENVTFIVLLNGKIRILTGTLKELDPYKTVTIDDERYPFIGYHVGIIKIVTEFGKMLYNNSYLSNEDNLDDFSVIEKKNQELFGDNYKEALNKLY